MGSSPRPCAAPLGAAGGAVDEEAQPKGTRNLEESATCTWNRLQRRRGRAGHPGPGAEPVGDLGPGERCQPCVLCRALSASCSPCPRDGSSLPRAPARPGAVLEPQGWK